MPHILLCRAGETEADAAGRFGNDMDLTGEGRSQVGRLRERLREFRVSAIYSSSQVSAANSADILSAAMDLSVTSRSELDELSWGVWDGLTKEEVIRRFPESWDGWIRQPQPDRVYMEDGVRHDGAVLTGESISSVQARARRFLAEIARRHADADWVCVVTHDVVIRVIVCDAFGIPLSSVSSFQTQPGSLTVFDWSTAFSRVYVVNDTSHLGAAQFADVVDATMRKQSDVRSPAATKVSLWNALTGDHATSVQWLDWHWQMRNRITHRDSVDRLKVFLDLDEEQLGDIETANQHFIMAVTPFELVRVASLLADGEKDSARRLQRVFLPSAQELPPHLSSEDDGMGEKGTSAFDFVSQLYRDRVLLFATDKCPVYCRYCFRRRKVIHETDRAEFPENVLQGDNLDKAAAYIEARPEIRDVIISGGEPLMLQSRQIERILHRVSEIPHVDLIRIDSKVPAVMPQRVTQEFAAMLANYKPVFMTLHFTHPAEIDDEVRAACATLADAGIPLGTYTPLMAGINDDREILKTLFWELVKMRVRPYYLVQYVPTHWTEHFRVTLKRAMSLLDGLERELSGIAIPTFKLYVTGPQGGRGKITMLPEYYRKSTWANTERTMLQHHFVVIIDGERIDVTYEEPNVAAEATPGIFDVGE